jgi:hypothetical protein
MLRHKVIRHPTPGFPLSQRRGVQLIAATSHKFAKRLVLPAALLADGVPSRSRYVSIER